MNEFDSTYLKQKLSAMSDDELYEMIQINASDYHQEAISLAKEEVARRQLTPTVDTLKLAAIIEQKKREAKEWNKNEDVGILRPAWRQNSMGLFSTRHYKIKRDSPCFFCDAQNPDTTKEIDIAGLASLASHHHATAAVPCCRACRRKLKIRFASLLLVFFGLLTGYIACIVKGILAVESVFILGLILLLCPSLYVTFLSSSRKVRLASYAEAYFVAVDE